MESEISETKTNFIEDKSNSNSKRNEDESNWKRNSIAFRGSVDDEDQISGIPHKFTQILYKRYHLQNSKLLLCSVCKQLLWDFQIMSQPSASLQAKSAKEGYHLFKCSACGFLSHKTCAHNAKKNCRSSKTMMLWTHEGIAENATKFQILSTKDEFQEIWLSHIERLVFVSNEYQTFRLSYDNLVQTELHSNVFPMFPSLKYQRVKMVASGTAHTLFLTDDGRVFTFGKNFSAQLGIKEADSNVNIETPVQITALSSVFVKKITCGGVHSAALTDNNEIYMWGDGRNGRIGFGSEESSALPRHLILREFLVTDESVNKENVLQDILSVDIICGWSHTMILLQTKDLRTFVFTCGRGSSGQCGHGEAKDEFRPRLVMGLLDKRIREMGAGYYHSVCICYEGRAYCFGFGEEGQCGQGNFITQLTPVLVPIQERITKIYCSSFHTFAISKSENTYMWGKLGTTVYFSPSLLDSIMGQKIVSMSTSMFQTAIILEEKSQMKSRDLNLLKKQTNLMIIEPPKRGNATSFSLYDLKRFSYTAKLLKLFEEDNKLSEKIIGNELKSCKKQMEKKQEVNMRSIRRIKTRDKLNEQLAARDEETRKLRETMEGNKNNTSKIEEAHKEIEKMRIHLALSKKELDTQRKELKALQKQIMDHRRRMLFELRFIFPIESPKMKGGHPTICNLPLPVIENFDFIPEMPYARDPFPKCDKEGIAAAMGYVAHLLCMISRYFELPMTYKIIPLGSRSLIVDRVNYQPGQPFPLFGVGAKNESFAMGLFLLHKNVEQLATHARFLYLQKPQFELIQVGHILTNVQQIMNVFTEKPANFLVKATSTIDTNTTSSFFDSND